MSQDNEEIYHYLKSKSLVHQELVEQMAELFLQLPEQPTRGKKFIRALAFCAYRVLISREDRVAIVTTMFDMTVSELAKVVTKHSVSSRMSHVVTPARIYDVAASYWERFMAVAPGITMEARQLYINEIDKFVGTQTPVTGVNVTRSIKGVKFSGPVTMIPVNDLALSILYYHINRMGYFGVVTPDAFVAVFKEMYLSTLIDLYQQLQALDAQIKAS